MQQELSESLREEDIIDLLMLPRACRMATSTNVAEKLLSEPSKSEKTVLLPLNQQLARTSEPPLPLGKGPSFQMRRS